MKNKTTGNQLSFDFSLAIKKKVEKTKNIFSFEKYQIKKNKLNEQNLYQRIISRAKHL